jgi:hypothetical protein
MKYIPLPLHHIEAGKPVPINVWDMRGNLLIRKGQCITSENHKEHLAAHLASATEADYKAWQRSYDRLIYAMVRGGASLEQIAATPMPSEILEIDFVVGHEVVGGWLDLHEVLATLLKQGAAAKSPLERVLGLQKRASHLLKADPDDSLFTLLQALPDRSYSYCAKHALLCAVLCDLTAQKLVVPGPVRAELFLAALLMNIGMAREHDELARQTIPMTEGQKQVVADHPRLSAGILRGFGLVNDDLLDIVLGHHTPDAPELLARNLECRHILHLADQFIAIMTDRSTRSGLSALSIEKTMLAGATDETAQIGAAMTAAIGFYPPGTYVTLVNGETAVVVRRGDSAHHPLVASIISPDGTVLGQYLAHDTREKPYAVATPVRAEQIRLKVNAPRARAAVEKLLNRAS